MSLADISMFYILGEDAHHRSFAQAWLVANNVHHRKIVPIPPPAGKGGGWKFVLLKCKETVEDALNRNRTKASTRVMIVIDADDLEVEQRFSQVAECIGQIDNSTESDIICMLVPKRHIETWVHALVNSDASVDEVRNYKEKTTAEVKQAARSLARLTSAPAQPSSLIRAYSELKRFKST